MTPPPPASGGSVGLGPWDWLDGVGLLAVVAGAVLRVTVVGLAYIKRGGVDKAVYADRLVTNGMLGHCRNPLYVGNLFILGGLFVIHNHPLVHILGGSFFVLTYIAMVANEERSLQSKFGEEFLAYQARVPRWGVKLPSSRRADHEAPAASSDPGLRRADLHRNPRSIAGSSSAPEWQADR